VYYEICKRNLPVIYEAHEECYHSDDCHSERLNKNKLKVHYKIIKKLTDPQHTMFINVNSNSMAEFVVRQN